MMEKDPKYIVPFEGVYHGPLPKQFPRPSETNEIFMIVLKHFENGSLTEYMNSNPFLDWNYRLHLLKDICHGLKSLHDHQILHGDFHPGNILIDRHGFAKISDFGLSRTSDYYSSNSVVDMAGARWIRAPEQFKHPPAQYNELCDIYSL